MHDWVVFKQSLGETGLTEGRDVAIEYRWAEDHNDRLPELAADLVRRGTDPAICKGGFDPEYANCQGTWPDHPDTLARACRRSDGLTVDVAFWQKADIVIALVNVCFRG
jgi:hypothetical protein